MAAIKSKEITPPSSSVLRPAMGPWIGNYPSLQTPMDRGGCLWNVSTPPPIPPPPLPPSRSPIVNRSLDSIPLRTRAVNREHQYQPFSHHQLFTSTSRPIFYSSLHHYEYPRDFYFHRYLNAPPHHHRFHLS